ncbi:hypothetical protein HF289_01615 [Acidithiobacillus ferrooxidans]|nr:hypothetical protein [Acidithiobacillus ferrooxidans]MBU2861750.1 hypothetical protein [Acidithiobacillus ferrooxidans]
MNLTYQQSSPKGLGEISIRTRVEHLQYFLLVIAITQHQDGKIGKRQFSTQPSAPGTQCTGPKGDDQDVGAPDVQQSLGVIRFHHGTD